MKSKKYGRDQIAKHNGYGFVDDADKYGNLRLRKSRVHQGGGLGGHRLGCGCKKCRSLKDKSKGIAVFNHKVGFGGYS